MARQGEVFAVTYYLKHISLAKKSYLSCPDYLSVQRKVSAESRSLVNPLLPDGKKGHTYSNKPEAGSCRLI